MLTTRCWARCKEYLTQALLICICLPNLILTHGLFIKFSLTVHFFYELKSIIEYTIIKVLWFPQFWGITKLYLENMQLFRNLGKMSLFLEYGTNHNIGLNFKISRQYTDIWTKLGFIYCAQWAIFNKFVSFFPCSAEYISTVLT